MSVERTYKWLINAGERVLSKTRQTSRPATVNSLWRGTSVATVLEGQAVALTLQFTPDDVLEHRLKEEWLLGKNGFQGVTSTADGLVARFRQ